MNNSNSTAITYITAFLDIGRGGWNNRFRRSFHDYLNSFLPFIHLFSNEEDKEQDMIVFIDKRHHPQLSSYLGNKKCRIRAIPIDHAWLNENSRIWRTLPTERAIMQSEEYKKIVGARIQYPETHIPEYTLINHAKIDFINYAISSRLSTAEYYCWVDFGYFGLVNRIPRRLIDLNKIPDLNKINYNLINEISPDDRDVLYTLTYAPEKVGGFWFFGRRSMMIEYQRVYHSVLDFYQSNKLADDDQALVLSCYFNHPGMFCLTHTGCWHQSLVLYSK